MSKSSGQSWTTFYRPQAVAELDQASVREQLEAMMKAGYFPRVLLLTGPKGTGKTTTARLIGAILNDRGNEELVRARYLKSKTDSDSSIGSLLEPERSDPLIQRILRGTAYVVQELDAASNRGIQEIRELKERVSLTPIEGVLSVYILDEVHMLTTPAFNALLKLLEEPPDHVLFILATTELEKIPETVRSRCQVIQFHLSTEAELKLALARVIKAEQLEIEAEALSRLASLAEGSFRDGVKYLQFLSTHQPITLELVAQLIQPSYTEVIEKLLRLLLAKEAGALVEHFADLREQVLEPRYLAKQLLEHLHQDLVKGLTEGEARYQTAVTLYLLREFKNPLVWAEAPIPLLGLEVVCLEMIEKAQKQNPPRKTESSSSTPQKTPTISPDEAAPEAIKVVAESVGLRPQAVSEAVPAGDAEQLLASWSRFTEQVAKKSLPLAALYRAAPRELVSPHTVRLRVFYRFHQEQLENPKTMQWVGKIVDAICAGPIKLEVMLSSAPDGAVLVEDPQLSSANSSLMNEVVEALL